MDKLNKKLRSEKGASITFGLLLFLICAVISSVVIVAATSAAGRMSGMSGSEQRYYSVTSTARMIQELLEDETTTVIKAGDKTYIGSPDGTATGNKLKDASKPNAIKTLSEYLAYKVSGSTSSNEIKLDATGDLNKAVSGVTVTQSISDGDMVLEVKSESEDKKDKYAVKLIFSKAEKRMPIEITSGDEQQDAEEITYTWDLKNAVVE